MVETRNDRVISARLFVVSTLVRIPFRSDQIFHKDSYALAMGVLYTLTAHPPGFIGYCVLVRLAYAVAGDVNLAFVVVNVLSTGIATALTYLLGRHMFGPREGVIAAVLYATSLNVSYFAEVALTYAAEGAFATCVGLTGWMSLRRRSMGWLMVHTVALGIGGSVRQTTLAFLFPLWLYVLLRSRPRWRDRALVALVLVLVVSSWWVPNARRVTRYWGGQEAGYVASVYRLQVAMDQFYDSASFGKVGYSSSVARFHWPLVELSVAVWNEIHAPASDASIEVRTASASNALRMIRYQAVKLAFYWVLSLGLATIFVAALALPRVRAAFDFDRAVFLALWIVPAAAFFGLNHFGAWGYLLVYLAACCAIAARVIARIVPNPRAQVLVVGLIALANASAFLSMRLLPETSDRNRTWNVALLQYAAPSIRNHFARARAQAYTNDPRQLPVDCVTDDCLVRDLPLVFDLPDDLKPVQPWTRSAGFRRLFRGPP